MIRGEFMGITPDEVGAVFGATTSSPAAGIGWMILACLLGFAVCAIGLQKGVEKITKVMMSCLFIVLLILIARAVTLPGAGEGLRFYLVPSLEPVREHGLWTIIYAAMGQAFFSLSLGMGSMAIFGSYLKKDRSLVGESRNIIILDTCAAIGAGLVIFPSCFAFGIEPGTGPGLIFVTIPNVFNHMPGGYFWGILFFVFMVFACLSTVIAVFENIVAFALDLTSWNRQKSVAINAVAVIILSLPCALGFNILAPHLGPALAWLGDGAVVLDLEDFILSQNILPLGAMIYVLFCTQKNGWGYKNFMTEVNAGQGLQWSTSSFIKGYSTYILPLLIIVIFVMGYVDKFF
jgi:NSS family neurotransmitter:Na+ symporter